MKSGQVQPQLDHFDLTDDNVRPGFLPARQKGPDFVLLCTLAHAAWELHVKRFVIAAEGDRAGAAEEREKIGKIVGVVDANTHCRRKESE